MLKRGLDIPAQNAEDVARRLTPVVQAGSVARWWENDSRIVRPAAGVAVATGTAGNPSWSAVVNPTGNKSLVYVEKVVVTCQIAGLLNLAIADEVVAGVAFGDKVWRDLRDVDILAAPILDTPAALIRAAGAAVPGLFQNFYAGHYGLAPKIAWELDVNVLLREATSVIFWTTALDNDVQASWTWREIREPR